MPTRGRFAGGDQAYLREVQYLDSTKLAARANLHIKYHTATIPWPLWVAQQVDWRGQDVLEAGCGPGWLWDAPAEGLPPGLRLTLTDQSAGMVDEATRRAVGAGHYATVRGCVADVQSLPFLRHGFDVVVANHMLYHAPSPARAVIELAGMLRPDGVLVAATNGPRHLLELGELQQAIFGVNVFVESAGAFGRVSGLPLLRSVFDSVEWREYPDELACTDPDDVVAFLASFPPGEHGTRNEMGRLAAAVARRFEVANGVMKITKDSGLFICRVPLTPHRQP